MDDDEWYYSLKDGRVVRASEARAADRLGPYPDKETAARALEIARERNEAREREDREWNAPGPVPDPDRD